MGKLLLEFGVDSSFFVLAGAFWLFYIFMKVFLFDKVVTLITARYERTIHLEASAKKLLGQATLLEAEYHKEMARFHAERQMLLQQLLQEQQRKAGDEVLKAQEIAKVKVSKTLSDIAFEKNHLALRLTQEVDDLAAQVVSKMEAMG